MNRRDRRREDAQRRAKRQRGTPPISLALALPAQTVRRDGFPPDSKVFYHATTPEKLPQILRSGFKDHAAAKGIPFVGVTHQFEPGVWLADVPPITAISMDQFLGHADEAWIEVLATENFYWRHLRGNEWQDASWPTRQWLVSAQAVNQLSMREVSLVDVLTMRLNNNSTAHHAFCTADVLRETIADEMSGAIQARWNAALDAAVALVAQGPNP